MQRFSESDLRTLRVGGIAAGLIVLFVAFGFPLMNRWDDLNTRLERAQKQLKTAKQGIEEAAAAQGALQNIRKKAMLFRDEGSLNQQTARMRVEVESLPQYGTLAVSRLEDVPLRNDEPLYRSAVSLQFSGTLANLYQFLRGVETATPALKVERLTLAAQQKNPARVEGQMVITGYAVVTNKKERG
jgi:hypothetical protein